MPIIRFRWGMVSRLHWFAASLRPVELLAPRYGSDQEFPQPTGTFTPELPPSRSPFSSSGITTGATERFHRWDFHPLESQIASLHRLFHPLIHAGLSRRTVIAILRQQSLFGRSSLRCYRLLFGRAIVCTVNVRPSRFPFTSTLSSMYFKS